MEMQRSFRPPKAGEKGPLIRSEAEGECAGGGEMGAAPVRCSLPNVPTPRDIPRPSSRGVPRSAFSVRGAPRRKSDGPLSIFGTAVGQPGLKVLFHIPAPLCCLPPGTAVALEAGVESAGASGHVWRRRGLKAILFAGAAAERKTKEVGRLEQNWRLLLFRIL
jgi:hypothetical protein